MSWNPNLDPHCPDPANPDAIETVIIPRARDLGGFEVRRALPAPRRQMVGPFIFFDQAGPAEFVTGQGIDVRISAWAPSPISMRASSSTAIPSAPTR
mgnify:CR=1 FL=1